MGKLGIWLVVILGLAAAGWGAWAYWDHDVRWRPKTITKHQAEIARILERSGWVSPGLQGPKLYMVGAHSCPDCARFKAEVFPALQAAGVDTRLIEVARPDLNGQSKSSLAERSTVAELWANRSWALSQRWDAAAEDSWTAAGITPADTDAGRFAIVEAGRRMVDDLKPLLADNGIDVRYPTLVWWTKDGLMRGCVCERPQTYRFVLADLGAGEKKP